MPLRPPIQIVLDQLLASSKPGDVIGLDQLGDALGARPAALDEIEAILNALEQAGRRVEAHLDGDPRFDLRTVMVAARALRREGLPPTIPLLAERTGLSASRVRAALLLGQVIGR